MSQERSPNAVDQLMIQIQELQNRVNSLTDARIFTILKNWATLEQPTIPANH